MSGAFAEVRERTSTIASYLWSEKRGEILRKSGWSVLGIAMLFLYTWLIITISRMGHHLEPPAITLARLQRNGHCMGCRIDYPYRTKRASDVFAVPLKSCLNAGLHEDSEACFTNCEFGFGDCKSINSSSNADAGPTKPSEPTPERVCVGTDDSGNCISWCKVDGDGMVYDCEGEEDEEEEEERTEEEYEYEEEEDGDSFVYPGINVIFGDPSEKVKREVGDDGLVDTGKLVRFCVCRRDVTACACETAPLRIDAAHGKEFNPFRTTLDLQSKLVDVEIGNTISIKERQATAAVDSSSKQKEEM